MRRFAASPALRPHRRTTASRPLPALAGLRDAAGRAQALSVPRLW
jgi:hypothetical protein